MFFAARDRVQGVMLRLDLFEKKKMFENVMLQNGYEERRWAIALRTAVFESKLQDAVEVGGSYGEIKEEILATFGQMPETL